MCRRWREEVRRSCVSSETCHPRTAAPSDGSVVPVNMLHVQPALGEASDAALEVPAGSARGVYDLDVLVSATRA